MARFVCSSAWMSSKSDMGATIPSTSNVGMMMVRLSVIVLVMLNGLDSSIVNDPRMKHCAVDNARIVQGDWAKLSVRKRARIVLKMRDYIVQNSEAIAEVISKDNGKTKIDALATEVMPAAMAISYYCKNADWFLSEEHLRAGNIFLINKRSKIERIPFGVIGIISPFGPIATLYGVPCPPARWASCSSS